MGTVVIGFDGTTIAEDALTFGAWFASILGDEVVVATVHPSSPPGAGHVDAEWEAAMRQLADDALDRARSLLGKSYAAEFRNVAANSAPQGLTEAAEDLGATAIVVGSGHKAALRRTATGSTSERLLQGTTTPVVIVPRGFRSPRDGSSVPALASGAVGCAFLDTKDGYEALRAATELARRMSARLRIFTVVAHMNEFATFPGAESERSFAELTRQTYQEALRAAAATVPDAIETTTELLEGDVVDALAALDERDVDVLVCGSRGYGPIRSVLLGGTSARLIRHAAAPVMVVPRSSES